MAVMVGLALGSSGSGAVVIGGGVATFFSCFGFGVGFGAAGFAFLAGFAFGLTPLVGWQIRSSHIYSVGGLAHQSTLELPGLLAVTGWVLTGWLVSWLVVR